MKDTIVIEIPIPVALVLLALFSWGPWAMQSEGLALEVFQFVVNAIGVGAGLLSCLFAVDLLFVKRKIPQPSKGTKEGSDGP